MLFSKTKCSQPVNQSRCTKLSKSNFVIIRTTVIIDKRTKTITGSFFSEGKG
jgi:hypothetical protein